MKPYHEILNSEKWNTVMEMELQAYKPEVYHMQGTRTTFVGESGRYKVNEIKCLPKVILPD